MGKYTQKDFETACDIIMRTQEWVLRNTSDYNISNGKILHVKTIPNENSRGDAKISLRFHVLHGYEEFVEFADGFFTSHTLQPKTNKHSLLISREDDLVEFAAWVSSHWDEIKAIVYDYNLQYAKERALTLSSIYNFKL